AACFDHGWRGVEGAADAALVARICARRGIPFFTGAADAEPIRPRRLSPEAAARGARYAFLASVCRREGFAAVATAHHARDQVETLLLRSCRGGRREGRAGILPVTALQGIEVVRPLLAVPAASLVAHAEQRRLPFREDGTNADPRFPRNRLRSRAAAPGIEVDAAAIVRLESLRRRLVEAAAVHAVERLVRQSGTEARVAAAPLLGMRSELRREVLRRSFHLVAAAEVPLPERALDGLERVLASPRGGRICLAGARAHVSCGELLLAPAGAPDPASGDAPRELCEAFDVAALRGRLVVRPWQPGDRVELRPCRGSAAPGVSPTKGGRKKVKEVFREARLPAWQRTGYPVVADDEGVLWVPGLWRGARALPRAGRPVCRVRIPDLAQVREAAARPLAAAAWSCEVALA
ncbi:MAG: tRNA lysidine(34) synthetase TilS, partial [Gemmatimonadota bacterium]